MGSARPRLPPLGMLRPARAACCHPPLWLPATCHLSESPSPHVAAKKHPWRPAVERRGRGGRRHRVVRQLRALGGHFAAGRRSPRRPRACSLVFRALPCRRVLLTALEGWRSLLLRAGQNASLSPHHARYSASTALQLRRMWCVPGVGRRASRAVTAAPALPTFTKTTRFAAPAAAGARKSAAQVSDHGRYKHCTCAG